MPKPKTLILPTVHLNGSSGDTLIEQLLDARCSVHDAMDKLRAATPNGRDYYPQGADALTKAREAHSDRVRRLQSVADELHELALGIRDLSR